MQTLVPSRVLFMHPSHKHFIHYYLTAKDLVRWSILSNLALIFNRIFTTGEMNRFLFVVVVRLLCLYRTFNLIQCHSFLRKPCFQLAGWENLLYSIFSAPNSRNDKVECRFSHELVEISSHILMPNRFEDMDG